MNGALLDTSFLITLTNAQRASHGEAVRYFRRLIGAGVPMYLSTIVISEFEVRQRIADLGLQNFLVLPFNIDDARATASLLESGFAARRVNQERVCVKDDLKLIAQCELAGVSHFFSDDKPCCMWIERLRTTLPSRVLPRAVYLGDGFNPTWFTHGQGTLLDD